jgi:hypothetical protein
LAREVATVTGQAGDTGIGWYETLAAQLDEQISDLFKQARAGGDVAGLPVDWLNLENNEGMIEWTAQETLSDAEAEKLWAQVLGKDLDSESNEDLDDDLFLETDEATK